MSKINLVIVLTVCLSLKCATSKPIGNTTFVEGINFEYKDGEWTCGDLVCPSNTFGCKIVKKTFEEDIQILHQAYKCFDEEKNVLLGSAGRYKLSVRELIVIDLETYIGAVSVFAVGYGIGFERATGVVAVDDLDYLKEEFRLVKEKTESEWGHIVAK